MGALGDAEEGGVPQFEGRQDREADAMVDRAGVVIRDEVEMGRPVRHDVETALLNSERP